MVGRWYNQVIGDHVPPVHICFAMPPSTGRETAAEAIAIEAIHADD